MVKFTDTSIRVYMTVLIFTLALNAFLLLIAFHNTIKYLCRPRSNKLLINLFYFFIITAFILKCTADVYMIISE